jgi:threonine dehydrogenase-like Zn-dependent dehydrogenase
MRQLTYVEAGRVEWQEAPDPVVPEPDGALLRPLAVARCDLDLPMAMAGLFPGPFAVGHETVADVVAVGDAVRDRKPGDRVLVPFQVSCGICAACRDGRFGGCETYRARVGAAFGFGPAGGGFGGAMADLLAVPAADHLLVPAPIDVSATVLATLPDNVSDGYRAAVPPLQDRPGAEVLVVGGMVKSVTLYAVAAALAAGSPRGPLRRQRRALPGRRGRPRRRGHGASRSVAAPLRARAHHRGRHGRRRRAGHRAPIDGRLWILHERGHLLRQDDTDAIARDVHAGITFHVSRADSRRLLPEVLALVASGRLDPLAIPTTIVRWEEAPRAWLEPTTKLVVVR